MESWVPAGGSFVRDGRHLALRVGAGPGRRPVGEPAVHEVGQFEGALDFTGQGPDAGASYLEAVPSCATCLPDGYVVKLDANGGFVWSRAVHSNDSSALESVAADGLGDLAVYGGFDTVLTIANLDASLSGGFNGTYQGYVTGLDPVSGAAKWVLPIGTGSTGPGAGLAYGPSGNLLLGASAIGAVDVHDDAGASSSQGLFAAQLGPTGAPAWSRTYGGPNDAVSAVAVDRCGAEVFMAGSVSGVLEAPLAGGGTVILDAGAVTPDGGVGEMFLMRVAR